MILQICFLSLTVNNDDFTTTLKCWAFGQEEHINLFILRI